MDSHEIFEVFRAFPHSDGTKNRFCPWSDTHVALLQSKMVSFTKISKSCFKVGLGISRTNADSQWNPVYNAFHRIFCGGNEKIRR